MRSGQFGKHTFYKWFERGRNRDGSEAVLIARNNLAEDLQKILDKLLFRIKAAKSAKENKYILLNAPNEKLEKSHRIVSRNEKSVRYATGRKRLEFGAFGD